MDRRGFLGAVLAGAASTALPALAAEPSPIATAPRDLWLQRGSEQVRACYWRDGQYLADGYSQLCWILRDVQAGRHVQMDPTLLEMLRWIQQYAEMYRHHAPIQIHSGYRTPATNARAGGARNSLHLQAKAVDFSLAGVTAESLAAVVQHLRVGGAGVYVSDGFVHADTGDVRSWQG